MYENHVEGKGNNRRRGIEGVMKGAESNNRREVERQWKHTHAHTHLLNGLGVRHPLLRFLREDSPVDFSDEFSLRVLHEAPHDEEEDERQCVPDNDHKHGFERQLEVVDENQDEDLCRRCKKKDEEVGIRKS